MPKTISIDFDGVLHSYTSGWKGETVIPDPPVPGAMAFLARCMEVFDRVVIHSTRASTNASRRAIRQNLAAWLEAEGFESDGLHDVIVTCVKKPCVVHLDDRAVQFNGSFPDPEKLARFEPWNRRTPSPVAPPGVSLTMPKSDAGPHSRAPFVFMGAPENQSFALSFLCDCGSVVSMGLDTFPLRPGHELHVGGVPCASCGVTYSLSMERKG